LKKLLIKKLAKKRSSKKNGLKILQEKKNQTTIKFEKKNQNYPKKIEKIISTKFDIEVWNWKKKAIKKPCKTKKKAIKQIRTKSNI